MNAQEQIRLKYEAPINKAHETLINSQASYKNIQTEYSQIKAKIDSLNSAIKGHYEKVDLYTGQMLNHTDSNWSKQYLEMKDNELSEIEKKSNLLDTYMIEEARLKEELLIAEKVLNESMSEFEYLNRELNFELNPSSKDVAMTIDESDSVMLDATELKPIEESKNNKKYYYIGALLLVIAGIFIYFKYR